MRPRDLRRLTAITALGLALTGCAALPELPDFPEPRAIEPSPPAIHTPTPGATTLSPDGFRTTERVAVRVRMVGCGQVGTGSGFAVDSHLLVTNRHVVAGADTLQVSTYDGQDVVVGTTGAAVIADLAVVRTQEPLPAAVVLAESDPAPGTSVEVIGYPGGGRLTASAGTVLGYQDDPLDANAGRVMVTDAPVEPGSSGSPVYDAAGHVVGVVYAGAEDGTKSLAVPVSTLRELLETARFDEVPPCD